MPRTNDGPDAMSDAREEDTGRDAYQDFLSDITEQWRGREKEADAGDIPVNVGERVKAVRQSRDLSIEDISLRTNIDVSILRDIETGLIAPPLGTIIKLSKALEMKLGYLISGEEDRAYTIVRHDDRRVVSRYDSRKAAYYGYEYESLAPHKKDRHMEPFLVTLEPSAAEDERSTHDGQEFIFVLQGKVEVRLSDEIHTLDPGDAIYYDSTVPHLVKCYGNQTTKILAVLYAEK